MRSIKNLFSHSSGFSLTEVLITVVFIGTLSIIAIPSYQKHRIAPVRMAMKQELSELLRFMEYAKAVDGGYHQKIFTMGYRPNKLLRASAGFNIGETDDICCASFPTASDLTNNSSALNPFFTLTDKAYTAGNIAASTRGAMLCSRQTAQNEHVCRFDKKLTETDFDNIAQNSYTFSSSDSDTNCKNAFSSQNIKCGCDTFKAYSIAHLRKTSTNSKWGVMFSNEKGLLCYADEYSSSRIIEYKKK